MAWLHLGIAVSAVSCTPLLTLSAGSPTLWPTASSNHIIRSLILMAAVSTYDQTWLTEEPVS